MSKKTIIITVVMVIIFGLSFLLVKYKDNKSIQNDSTKELNKIEKVENAENKENIESNKTDSNKNDSTTKTTGLCESACNNYTLKCVSLVPNADQQLFESSNKSCLEECAKWDNEKINCVINETDCESIVDKCDL